MFCDCEFSINFAVIVKGTMTTTHSYTGDQVYILLTPSHKFCPVLRKLVVYNKIRMTKLNFLRVLLSKLK